MPIFDSSRDEHLFHKELSFWGFPDAEYLFNKRLQFPQELLDIFKVEPSTGIDQKVLSKWKELGQLNIYDLMQRNKENGYPDFNSQLQIQLIEDSNKVYYGQVDLDKKRSGFGRYISLFNGSIYEGHCINGQQYGFGR